MEARYRGDGHLRAHWPAWSKSCREYNVWLLQGHASANVHPRKDDPAANHEKVASAAIARAIVEQSWNIVCEELKRVEATMPPFKLVPP